MRVEDQEEQEPILDNSMTPDEISQVISEDLEPGTLGLIDEEDRLLTELVPPGAAAQPQKAAPQAAPQAAPNPAAQRAAQPAPAAQQPAPAAGAGAGKGAPAPVDASRAMATVDALAQHMDRYADDLQKAAQTADARSARLRLGELLGAVNQAKKEIDALCKQMGLPDVAY